MFCLTTQCKLPQPHNYSSRALSEDLEAKQQGGREEVGTLMRGEGRRERKSNTGSRTTGETSTTLTTSGCQSIDKHNSSIDTTDSSSSN